ncbi:MAG: TolC family protein [bacterium]
MSIKKLIKIFIFVVAVNFLATACCFAQEIMLDKPQNTTQNIGKQEQPNNADAENINPEEQDQSANPATNPSAKQNSTTIEQEFPALNELLKKNEPPKEVPKEKRAERPKNANPNKPDICGSIIFDLTQKEQPISLKDTLEIAMEKNFNIKIFAQKAESDKWIYYGTIANFLPDIDGAQTIQKNTGEFIVNTVIPDQVKETAYRLNFDYSYFISIRKYFDLQIARTQYKAQKKQLEFTKDQVLKNSATKYYELLESKRGIEILKTNIKQITEQLRINKEKNEAGIGTKFDVLRAQADLARANQSLTLAENQYRLNQAQLANIIGISVFTRLVPDDNDIKIKEIFKDCFDLDRAKELAMTNRADLQSAKFDIEAARQKRNLGYANYLPDIALYGQVSRQGTFQSSIGPNRFVGVAVGWNLAMRRPLEVDYPAGMGLGLFGYTDIKSRSAQLEESKLTYINKSRDIDENIVKTFFNTVTARSLIDSTWSEVQASAESRNIAVVRLRAGIGTFIDVLQAQTTYTSAKINHLNAVVSYNISQVELLFEMGVISVNNILNGFNSSNCETSK